jgi:hypothetical protein
VPLRGGAAGDDGAGTGGAGGPAFFVHAGGITIADDSIIDVRGRNGIDGGGGGAGGAILLEASSVTVSPSSLDIGGGGGLADGGSGRVRIVSGGVDTVRASLTTACPATHQPGQLSASSSDPTPVDLTPLPAFPAAAGRGACGPWSCFLVDTADVGRLVRPFSNGALAVNGDGANIQQLLLAGAPDITATFFVPALRDLAVPADNFAIGLSATGTIHYGSFAGAPEGGGAETADQQLAVVSGTTSSPIRSGFVVVTRAADGSLAEVDRNTVRTPIVLPDPGATADVGARAIAGFADTLAVLHTNRVALYARAPNDPTWDLVASATLPIPVDGGTIAFHDRHVVVGAPRDDRCGAGSGSVLVYRLFRPGDPGAGSIQTPVLVLKHTFASHDPVEDGAFGRAVSVQTLDAIGGTRVVVGSVAGLDVFTTRTEDALPHTFARDVDTAVGVADVQLREGRLWVGRPDGNRGLTISRSLP